MKRTPGDSELLTLDKAAEQLGWRDTTRASGSPTARARRLFKAIRSRERETGKRILHRRQTKYRRHKRVTMLALREHLPELFPGERTRLADEGQFKQVLRSIDDRIAGQVDPVKERLAKVEYHGLVTREMVESLGIRLLSAVGSSSEQDANKAH